MRIKHKRTYREEVKEAYHKLRKAYRELKNSNIQMIFRLAVMAEYRDLTTGTHLVRIADYSAIVADALGLSKAEVALIRYASPMHDIGKIILPDSILKKSGKLTQKERQIMKNHPLVGAEIFRNANTPLMKACGVIALAHHERYDGSGYPNGLKGDEIPLYARIVGVADVFDALTSKRSYKEAYGFEKSVSMIQELAGTQFDPVVVEAFVRNKRRIKGIWQANKDIENFLKGKGISADEIPNLDLKVSLSFPFVNGSSAAVM